MIKVEVTEQFNLQDFSKIKNLKRKSVDISGKLLVGDTFECSKDFYELLTEKNEYKRKFVKAIEVKPTKL